MYPEHRPDSLEKIIRFVCGAVAGGGVAFVAVGQETFSGRELALAVVVGALAVGLCAMVSGDRFWRVFLSGLDG